MLLIVRSAGEYCAVVEEINKMQSSTGIDRGLHDVELFSVRQDTRRQTVGSWVSWGAEWTAFCTTTLTRTIATATVTQPIP